MLENIICFLTNLLSFDAQFPLLFTQFYFWAFFALVFAGLTLLKKKILQRNTFLMFVSLFFYFKTSGLFVILLLFTTLNCFWVGKRIDVTVNLKKRKWFVFAGIFINLLLLAYFKYAYFFTSIYNSMFNSDVEIVNYLALWANNFTRSTYFRVDNIILPVGISFYTFQSISYIIDVYRRRISHTSNFFDFGFFVSFFPGLVAGPIIRANQFMPQLYKKFFLSRRQFGKAVFWILNGLIKKLILSDYLAVNFVDRVIENPHFFTSFENLAAIFVYSLQVYADFSGYTDIAIGVAMLMGFYMPKNFNSPYKATNAGDFWKRWHISLSTWLKDYLYIPLGGNRKGKFRTNVNTMLTMLLGGLWHGASWNFVIWGGLNGLGILIFKRWRKFDNAKRMGITLFFFNLSFLFYVLFPYPALKIATVWTGIICLGGLLSYFYVDFYQRKPLTKLNRGWSIFLTFLFITFTRLFFRSGSNLDPSEQASHAWKTAKVIVNQIGGTWNWAQIPEIIVTYWAVFLLFALGMFIHWFPERWKRWYRLNFALLPLWVIGISVVVVVFVVYQFITADLQPFIYFQF
ncbi:MAG: MBOAT family protein [Bacteroidales bacterium]|jgi:D-alanyl-lipoteichoic acid acyltransferase DltB (MBOAT superfamily)|nr:MBOAT family protein [Bacteroidales bacterium]